VEFTGNHGGREAEAGGSLKVAFSAFGAKRAFTAEDAKVAEEIFLSNPRGLRLNLRPSAKSADHSEEIIALNLHVLCDLPR